VHQNQRGTSKSFTTLTGKESTSTREEKTHHSMSTRGNLLFSLTLVLTNKRKPVAKTQFDKNIAAIITQPKTENAEQSMKAKQR